MNERAAPVPAALGAAPHFRLRVLSSVALMPVGLAAAIGGGVWTGAAIGLGGLLLAREWLHVTARRAASVQFAVYALSLIVAIGLTVWLGAVDPRWRPGAGVLAIGAGAAFALCTIVRRPTLWAPFGLLYIGLPAVMFVWLRETAGPGVAVSLFAAVWATDTGAYGFGKLIGGPQFAPAWSPNKTWAGVIGGLFTGLVLGGLAFWVLSYSAWPAFCTAGVLALATQLGDLMESALKRHFGAKDMGSLVPGHGGLFDRLDGFLIAVLAMAVLQAFGSGG